MPSDDYNSNPFFTPPADAEGSRRVEPPRTIAPIFTPPSPSPIVDRAENVVSSYLRPAAYVEKHPVEYYQDVPYSDVLRRLKKSAPESAKGVVRKTVEGIGNIPEALTGLGTLAESGVYNIPYLGAALAGSKEELEKKRAPLRQLPSALYSAGEEAAKYIGEGYGSEAAIKKTLAEDPFKLPSDIASAATLTGTGLTGASKLVPGKIGERVAGLGAGLTKAGEITSPITAPYKAAEYAVGTVAPELVKHYLHGTSGLSKESLDEFMKAGLNKDPTVANVMAGKITPEMTVQSVADAISKKKAQRETAYLSGMNQAQQNTIANTPIPYTDITNTVAKAYRDYTSGPMQFAKNKDALNAIQKADTLVQQWETAAKTHPYYSTAKGIDDLKQAIDGIMDEHESNAAKKALGAIRNSAKGSIAKLDKGYAETLDHYSQESTAIDRLVQGLQRGDPNINVGGNIRNLIRSTKDEFRKGLLEDLLEHDPTLLSQLAAHELHGAAPFSMKRALGAMGVTALAATAMPQIPMLAYLGGLGAASLPFTSPTAAAFTAKKIGQAKRIGRPIAKAIPPAFSVGYLAGEDQSQAPMAREGVLDKSNFFSPPGEAHGGRIGRATGGGVNRGMTAQMLIAAVERAKAEGQKTTESILEQPDEHVVRALKVANENI